VGEGRSFFLLAVILLPCGVRLLGAGTETRALNAAAEEETGGNGRIREGYSRQV
jgi:hypothetical protein